jgi:hypothetical protein
MPLRLLRIALLAAALLVSGTALAKKPFKTKVPNGAVYSCSTCHISTNPPTSWNDFGLDVKGHMVAGQPDWATVCEMDSDGDGWTNGEELLDPECVWGPFTPDPGDTGDVTKPGDPNSFPPEPEPEPEPEPDVMVEQEADGGPAEADIFVEPEVLFGDTDDAGPPQCFQDEDCDGDAVCVDGSCAPGEGVGGDTAADTAGIEDTSADEPAPSGGGSSGGCAGGGIPAHSGLAQLFGLLGLLVLSNRRRGGLV